MVGEPLTSAQLGIWLGHQRSTDASLFNCGEVTDLVGPFCPERFERALLATHERAPSLHVAFREVEGTPRAVRPDCPRPDYAWVDLSGEQAPERALERELERELWRPFDLEQGGLSRHRLFKLDGERHVWLHAAHHLALDGFGFHLVARSVAEHYRDAGDHVAFGSMREVIRADQAYAGSADEARDRTFWLEGPLSELRGVSLASTDAEPPEPVLPLRRSLLVEAERFGAWQRAALKHDVSWSELLLAAIGSSVYQQTGRARFALGLPVMLRVGTPALKVPCMAMNIVRLPVVLTPGMTLFDLARAIRSRLIAQAPHQRFRYEALRSPGAADLSFGPVVNVMPFTRPASFGQARAVWRNLSAGPVQDVSFAFASADRALEFAADGDPRRYDATALERLQLQIVQAVGDAMSSPERPLRRSVHSVPSRVHTAPSLPERIRGNVAATPDASALEHQGQRWTYAELHRAALGWAGVFGRYDVRVGDLVALELPRCPAAIVLLLACLYAGCGYVVLDPAQPSARRRAILELARPKLVISTWAGGEGATAFAPSRPSEPRPRRLALHVDQLGELGPWSVEPPASEPVRASDDSAAYVVFTSGSTGEPKGVTISRGALSFFVHAAQSVYGVTAADRVLQFAPLAFDASVEEIFVTWAAGATLVLRDDAMLESMSAFTRACAELGITILDLPTGFWHELAWALEHRALECPRGLRLLIIGGEAALEERVRAWLARAPHVRLLNTYGPSEATVVATVAELHERSIQDGLVSIGQPLPGVVAVVLDPSGEPCPEPECEGELGLAGPGLSSGYLHRDDLTAARFELLYTPEPQRVYKTGDRVRRSATGELYYVGRIDNEIKFSGYRICPEEVEATLARHPAVRAAVVQAWRAPGSARLVADVETDGALTSDALRTWLGERLPAAMVPARLRLHEKLPRTNSGKLDRVALALTSAELPRSPEAATLEPNALESVIVAVWREVLGLATLGIDDDFFALGGQSLQVIQVANRLSRLGQSISVAEIFRAPTPRGLAARLADSVDPAAPSPSWQHVADPPASWFSERGAAPTPPPNHALDSVLLTGATGFVGLHLLAALLEQTSATITCLIRASSDAAARERLAAALRAQGLPVEGHGARVRVLCCGSAPGAELSPTLLEALPRLNAVVHCAAEVSLTRDFASLRAVNVDLTRSMIEVAARRGARLHHVSTIATLPRLRGVVAERAYDAHAGLVDGYQQSKWHAEQLCRRAAEHGLDVHVYRLGRVTGSTRRASVNARDLLWRIARSAVRCGAWPALDVREPWTPVDEVADTLTRAVLAVERTQPDATRSAEAQFYHVVHTGTVHLERLRQALIRRGHVLPAVPLDVWFDRVRAGADEQDQATLAFFELRSSAPSGGLGDLSCQNLRALLPELGGTPVSDELIDRYCEAAARLALI